MPAVSPATTSNPLMSLSHSTRAAKVHLCGERSCSEPSATLKPTTLLVLPTVATVAAIVLPSGDHDGPVKKIGANLLGKSLTESWRSLVPSMLAMISALLPAFG